MNEQPSTTVAAPDSTKQAAVSPSIGQLWTAICSAGLIKLFLAVSVLLNIYCFFEAATSRFDQQDFAHYYASSYLFLEGQENLYRVDLRPHYEEFGWHALEEPVFRATNPPALLQAFTIIASMPPRTAHFVWLVVQAVSLAFSIWTTWRLFKPQLSSDALCAVVSVFLLLPFVRSHLVHSQVQIPLMALILFAFWLLRKSNVFSPDTERVSFAYCIVPSLIVAFASLIKIYPLALLPWFVWRSSDRLSLRFVLGFVCLFVLGLGVLLTDLSMWREFVEVARPSISAWVQNSECFTFSSAASNVGYVIHRPDLVPQLFNFGVATGVGVLGCFYAWIVFGRRGVCESGASTEFALLILLMLFCGVTCWWHYLVFLLFPMAVIAHLLRDRFSLPVLFGCSLVIAMLMSSNGSVPPESLGAFFLLYKPLVAMLAMACYLCFAARRIHPNSRPERNATSHAV